VVDTTYAEGHLDGVLQRDGITKLPATIVATVSLDAIVEQLGVRPNAIKIDVEGAELRVLRGAEVTLRQFTPKVFLSVHSPELRHDCLEYLGRMGYHAKALRESIENASEYVLVWR
jgi:hypothetical protein